MNKTPKTEAVVKMAAKMAAGPLREYAIIEHAQTLERENINIRKALCEALSLIDPKCCGDFHHEKKNRHEFGETCPLLERHKARIARLEEAAK